MSDDKKCVLVSPKGREYPCTNKAECNQLKAKGYKCTSKSAAPKRSRGRRTKPNPVDQLVFDLEPSDTNEE
jgi:hypothetical protein